MRHLLSLFVLLSFSTGIWSADAATGSQPSALTSSSVVSVSDPATVDVVVTDKGTKYHTKDCRYAKQGTSEPLATALKDGLAPCTVCHPPIYDPTLITVYTGGDKSTKYHSKECRFAKSPETLAQAAQAGQEPCKVCHAPPLPPGKATGSAVTPAKDK